MKFTNKEIYKKIKCHILLLIKNSPKKNFVYPHLHYTEKWVLRLKPNADFALRIAALIHDIDRAAIKNRIREEKIMGSYRRYKSQHIKNSLAIIQKILKQFNITKQLEQKVLFLIKNHEEGIKDANHLYYRDLRILIDADALAFFEELNEYYKTWGEKITKNKVEYTWLRLSEKAKKIAFKKFSKKLKALNLKVPNKV